MRIQSQLPDSSSASQVMGTKANQAAQIVQNDTNQLVQPQVDFAMEGQIRSLLEQVVKLLEHQDKMISLLPESFLEEPAIQNALLQSAQEALTNGLPSLLKASKTVADNLNALAEKAGNAALLRAVFPEGAPEALTQEAQATMSQVADEGSNLTNELQGLIKQFINTPVPNAKVVANFREACRNLLPEATDSQAAALLKELSTNLLTPGQRQTIPASVLPQLTEILAWVKLADSVNWQTVQPPLSEPEKGALRDLANLLQQLAPGEDIEPQGAYSATGGTIKEPSSDLLKNIRQFVQRGAQALETVIPQAPVQEADGSNLPGLQSTPRQTIVQPGATQPPAAQAAAKAAITTPQTVAEEFTVLIQQLIETNSGEQVAGRLRAFSKEILPERLPPEVFAKLDDAFSNSLPHKLNQAVENRRMPELRQALAWLKVAESVEMAHLPTASLKQAEETLKEMATLAQRSTTQPVVDTIAGQKTLTFAFPMYLGEEKKPYPTYIHISQDRESPKGGRGETVRDTWLRLCLLTENLGLVDLIFHLYGKNMLTIKAGFGEEDIAASFRRELNAIRKKFQEGPFTLADITVTAPTTTTELPLAEPTLGVYDHNGKPV